jgi:hypothetical protein
MSAPCLSNKAGDIEMMLEHGVGERSVESLLCPWRAPPKIPAGIGVVAWKMLRKIAERRLA